MATLLLRLVGPMQSWGTTSRFSHRDTGKEPSKSGVIGLLAAALGIDRADWAALKPLTRARMGVRHDRAGVPRREYQTALDVISADGTRTANATAVTTRDYLADAAFLVGLEHEERPLLERADGALRNPVWPLALGRRSYVPSEPVWVEGGVVDDDVCAVLSRWPWVTSCRHWERPPHELLVSLDSGDGSGAMKMDQPTGSFAARVFGPRMVRSVWIPFPQEGAGVSQ